MAMALSEYDNVLPSDDKKGWDYSVAGEHGILRKQFGNRMREIIWEYKYGDKFNRI